MTSKCALWLMERFPIVSFWRHYFSHYYVAKNLNIYYCFGLLALLILGNQLVTGFWLTLFYMPTVQDAFTSVEVIMRDVNFGWLFRYMHSTGASAFYVVIYLHIFRGLLYGSYQRPRELVWLMGVLLFLMLIMEGFFGYLLPWGQLSYWSVEVVTALFGVIPYVGDTLVTWIRGDFSVGQPTLQRFFALHVIGMPLLLVVFSGLHVVALRHVGSSNPDGVTVVNAADKVPFYPDHVKKECLVVMVFLLLFFAIVFFVPAMNGYFLEPANAEPANRLVTPNQMTPLWYMAPFYAMLRAIPDKTMGVGVMFFAVLILFLLPWLDRSSVQSMRYKGRYSRIALGIMVASFVLLGYLGTSVLTVWNRALSQVATMLYFAYFLLMPLYTRVEKTRPLPSRICV